MNGNRQPGGLVKMNRALASILCAFALFAAGPTSAAAPRADEPWSDYRIIMWQPHSTSGYRTLAKLGIDAAMVSWRGVGTANLPRALRPLDATGLDWYFENVATDFYASYHRFTQGKPVNWRFIEAKKRYRENPDDPTVFYREPGLSDPAWLARIRARMAEAVNASPRLALFYNLGDESGIADNGSYWDFDMAPDSLAAMRVWLKDQYATLDALNREWNTGFTDWDAVVPMTTNQAFARPGDNFAPWADFKAWMDVAFARAIRIGADAVHKANPHARAAIEGGQIPGWGGYDYAKLTGTVDVMEIYDYAQNVDVVRSLAPETVLLATSGGSGPAENHRRWGLLLRGGRGLILWDPNYQFIGEDGTGGPRAAASAEIFRKLKGGIGALVIGSERQTYPVAMLYSPASFRTQWMLDVRPTGAAWSERNTDSEYEDNNVRAARRGYWNAFVRLGIEPRFVTDEQIADGILERRGDKVLMLPHAIALSDKAADAVRRFAEAGGRVVADVVPGAFDAHSKRRDRPALADLFAASATGTATLLPVKGRDEADLAATLSPVLAKAGIAPAVTVEGGDGKRPADVETYSFRNGAATVVALWRKVPKDAETLPAEHMTLAFPAGSYVTDLMAGSPPRRADRVAVALGSEAPALFAVSPRLLPELEVEVPATLARGATGTIHVSRASTIAALRPIHVEMTDPAGEPVPPLSGNLRLTGPTAAQDFTMHPDAPAGTWRMRVTDLVAGTVRDFSLAVE